MEQPAPEPAPVKAVKQSAKRSPGKRRGQVEQDQVSEAEMPEAAASEEDGEATS